MTTYFDTIDRSFADVSLEPGIDTAQFLEASKGLVGIFNLLGSTAFGAVISDLNGNIAKIQTRLDADPEHSKTLEGMLAEEAKGSDKKATQALLWLLRGLEFTLIGMKNSLEDDKKELSVSFTEGYETTLKPHHNFIVKGIFKVAMKACPYRKDFFETLGSPPERVHEQGTRWLNGLDVIVKKLKALYAEKDYGKGL